MSRNPTGLLLNDWALNIMASEVTRVLSARIRNNGTVKYALSICSSESTDAGPKASGLHEVLSNFKFFFGLILIAKCS